MLEIRISWFVHVLFLLSKFSVTSLYILLFMSPLSPMASVSLFIPCSFLAFLTAGKYFLRGYVVIFSKELNGELRMWKLTSCLDINYCCYYILFLDCEEKTSLFFKILH